MYYEYWGLKKPPFDNVPDPSMYVETHSSVENAIVETIFAIEGGNDCISVIVGDIGVGKTLSLKMILDSLDQEKYKVAFITNPDMSFIQLLREIIKQLTGKQCEAKQKADLLEIFNKLLFETVDQDKRVLIFIDEANAISPTNLESLRLLTNMQEDNRNLFTIVLSGQMELAQRLEHPKRASLFQRVGSYNKINRLQSEDMTREYVETRLRLAGATNKIFTDKAIGHLWRYSDQGTPRLINKICKLSLKVGEANSVNKISGDIVKQIGERFGRLTGPAIQKRKPRKRVPDETFHEQTAILEDEKTAILARGEARKASRRIREEFEGLTGPAIQKRKPRKRVPDETSHKETWIQEDKARESVWAKRGVQGTEANIGKFKIGNIDIPSHIVKQAKSTTKEHQVKLAGVLAAQTLRKYPELKASPSSDPVGVWGKVRDLILHKLKQEMEAIKT